MNENYQIILFCVEYAMKNAFQPATSARIADAMLWLEKMAQLDCQLSAKESNDD
jgi:hypothetical protein